MNVVVYRSGALGDLVVTFPVLQSIRHSVDRADITLVAPPDAGALATMSGWADRLISCDAQWIAKWYAGDADPVRSALGHVDTMVIFAANADALAEIARRAGIRRTHAFPPLPGERGIHATDHSLACVEPVFGAAEERTPIIMTDTSAREDAARALGDAGVPAGSRYAIVHVGSSSPHRTWPSMYEMLTLLASDYAGCIVANRGPVEMEREPTWRSIEGVLPIGPIPATTLAAVIEGATFYVGNDTGPTHLAAAVGTETIAVFGPQSDANLWAPRGRHVRMVDGGDAWPTVENVASAMEDLLRR